MDIYYERQRNDLCRLHSINAYYGYSKLSEQEFYIFCEEYDTLIKGLKSRNMDGFAEGRSIISYILDKISNKYVFLIPINSYSRSREHIDTVRYSKLLQQLSSFFEFNKNHVWFNKKINNKWYKIDSISGVNRNDPSLSNNGYLLIFEDKLLYMEIEYYIFLLKNNKSNNFILEKEIALYNLYHSLKCINTNLTMTNDPIFNENLIVLKKLKDNLLKYVYLRRNQKKSDKEFEIIEKLINLFVI